MLPSEGFWGAKLGNFTESSAHYTLKLVNWACAVMSAQLCQRSYVVEHKYTDYIF